MNHVLSGYPSGLILQNVIGERQRERESFLRDFGASKAMNACRISTDSISFVYLHLPLTKTLVP